MADEEEYEENPRSIFAVQSHLLNNTEQDLFGTDHSQELWDERETHNALRHVSHLSGSSENGHETGTERTILIGVYSTYTSSLLSAEESLRELAALVQTDGAVVCDGILQQRTQPDALTYFGSGKAKELASLVAAHDIDTIVVNAEITPAQRKNLEDITHVKVIDRTAIILDIFAQNASSREGKAQAELAQLEYTLPRLQDLQRSLSRQGGGTSAQNGGMGSRGPGETRLELDRRIIHNRINKLKKDIKMMELTRQTKRNRREKNNIPVVALIGYTNAGKSSLLNTLTHADELIGNALFATLDTAVRQAITSTGRLFTIVDTVGFIQDLPTQLIESFKSTLEEMLCADTLVYVVDASSSTYLSQLETVQSVVHSLDMTVSEEKTLLVFTKIDLIPEDQLHRLQYQYPHALFISTKKNIGITELQTALEKSLPCPSHHYEGTIDYHDGNLIPKIQKTGVLHSVSYTYDGIKINADIDNQLYEHIQLAQCNDK